MTQVFHKVRLKPGKPLWFGLGPRRGEGPRALVFGLPGNPVSGLVGFLLFIRPALRVLAGHPGDPPEPESLPAGDPGSSTAATGPRIIPRGGEAAGAGRRGHRGPGLGGSADLVGVARADGLAMFPAGDRVFEPGEIVGFLPLG